MQTSQKNRNISMFISWISKKMSWKSTLKSKYYLLFSLIAITCLGILDSLTKHLFLHCFCYSNISFITLDQEINLKFLHLLVFLSLYIVYKCNGYFLLVLELMVLTTVPLELLLKLQFCLSLTNVLRFQLVVVSWIPYFWFCHF